MECPVCNDTFVWPRQPLLLPCLHTICSMCVNDILNDSKAKGVPARCLECLETFDPKTSMVNFLVQPSTTSPQPVCADCAETQIASHECQTCQDPLCSSCVEHHRRSKHTRHHIVVPLENVAVDFGHSQNSHFCTTHTSNSLCAVCVDCEVIVCLQCIIGTHCGHECLDFNKGHTRYLSHITAGVSHLQNYIPTLDTAVSDLNKLCSTFKARQAEITAEITTSFDDLINCLSRRRDALIAEAQTSLENGIKTAEVQREALVEIKSVALTACHQANLILATTGTESICDKASSSNNEREQINLLRLDTMISRRIKQLIASEAPLAPISKDPVHFSAPRADSWKSSTEQLGRVHTLRSRNYLSIKLPMHVWGASGTTPGQLRKPTGLASDITNDQVIVADCHNLRLQVFSMDGKVVRTVSLGQSKPFAVAVALSGDIWVALREENCVRCYSPEGIALNEILFDYPQGVVVLEDGAIIISGRRRVRLFSPDGVERWCYRENRGALMGLVASTTSSSNPQSSTTTSSIGEVFVCSHRSNSIDVISLEDGHLVRQIGTGLLRAPNAVALSRDGLLFVTENPQANDPVTHCISIFTKAGDRIHVWGSHSGFDLGMFHKPWGIAVMSDGLIAIADHGNNRLQIF